MGYCVSGRQHRADDAREAWNVCAWFALNKLLRHPAIGIEWHAIGPFSTCHAQLFECTESSNAGKCPHLAWQRTQRNPGELNRMAYWAIPSKVNIRKTSRCRTLQ